MLLGEIYSSSDCWCEEMNELRGLKIFPKPEFWEGIYTFSIYEISGSNCVLPL